MWKTFGSLINNSVFGTSKVTAMKNLTLKETDANHTQSIAFNMSSKITKIW